MSLHLLHPGPEQDLGHDPDQGTNHTLRITLVVVYQALLYIATLVPPDHVVVVVVTALVQSDQQESLGRDRDLSK